MRSSVAGSLGIGGVAGWGESRDQVGADPLARTGVGLLEHADHVRVVHLKAVATRVALECLREIRCRADEEGLVSRVLPRLHRARRDDVNTGQRLELGVPDIDAKLVLLSGRALEGYRVDPGGFRHAAQSRQFSGVAACPRYRRG